MMNPIVTPDTDLTQILSEHQLSILRALRDGAVLEVARTESGGIDGIALLPASPAQKLRYIRLTTFDYLSRIHLIESESSDGSRYSLSQLAMLCLAKLDGTSLAAVEAPAEAPMTEVPAAQVTLSQAQIRVVQALVAGAVLKTLWRNERLIAVELVKPDGRTERVHEALFQSLMRKGLLSGDQDEFRLGTDAYPLVQRYL